MGIVIAEAPGGRVVMGNRRAEVIFGGKIVGSDIAAGERWADRDGRLVEAQEHPLVRAMALGETTGAEEFCYRKDDGSKVGVSVTAAPILGVGGAILGGVLTIRES